MRILTLLIIMICGSGITAQENQTDSQGRKHGIWKKYYENGKLRFEGRFEHGAEVDTFKFYYDDGRLQALNYFRSPQVVYSKLFGDDKKLAAEGLYLNRKKDSVWTYYDVDGNIVSTESFEDGKLNGTVTVYFADGKKAEVTEYKNGLKHGKWNQFFEDGKPRAEGQYVEDKLHGEVSYFHPNGKIMAKGKYIKGRMHGTWFFFTENFKLDHKEEWKYGRRIDEPKEGEETDEGTEGN